MLYDETRQEVADRFYDYFDADTAERLGDLCWDDGFLTEAAEFFVTTVEVNGGRDSYKSAGLYTPMDMIHDVARAAKIMQVRPDVAEVAQNTKAVIVGCGVPDGTDPQSLKLQDIPITAYAYLGGCIAFDDGLSELMWEDDGVWFEYDI